MNNGEPIKIAIFNQKGGVGKTTFTFNGAGIMAKTFGKKVLVIDADPQKNVSTTLLAENIREWEEENNEDFFESHITLGDCLENINDKDLVNKAIIKAKILAKNGGACKWRGIDVLPSKRSLAGIEVGDNEDIKKLVDRIRPTREHMYNYDIILFDMPPYLSDLSVTVLAGCDFVVTPATVDKDSLAGYSELLDTIKNLQVLGINPKIKSIGIFLTMIDNITKYDKEKYIEIKDALGENMFDVPIRRDSRAKYASDYGCPLAWYKRNATITKDFEIVVAEILKRVDLLEEDRFNLLYKEEIQKRIERYE